MPNGAKVPGTPFQLDPVQAAFNIGAMIRWLDFNDTWLAAEWGHPSDNLGGILAVADWLSRNAVRQGKPPLTMRDVLTAMIKAHEIQGVLALENSFNRVGLDHVVLVKVASTAVVAQMLGLTRDEIINARVAGLGRRPVAAHLSPRAEHRLAQELGGGRRDQPRGAPRADREDRRDGLSVGAHGEDLGLLRRAVQGQRVQVPAPVRQLRDGERAVQDLASRRNSTRRPRSRRRCTLHAALKKAGRGIDDIKRITIRTHEACIRIIDKKGPLDNPADRDHCIQYMVAVPLIFGRLTAADYEDAVAADPRIDALRDKIVCVEDKQFTRDYHDPEKRSIANALHGRVQGRQEACEEIVVEYPIGHAAGARKACRCWWRSSRPTSRAVFPAKQQRARSSTCALDPKQLEATPVHEFVDLMVI